MERERGSAVSNFPGTEHYRQTMQGFMDDVYESDSPPTLEDAACLYANTTRQLCDHIEERDKEIERLKGVVEHHMRKAHDEHVRWSGHYYEECTKNADLGFRIAQLEKELSTRTESSEGKP